MALAEYEHIWSSDYWDIYLKRVGEKIQIIRYSPLDYEYMEDYINDNHDIRGEWQDDVWNWNTEMGYDEWREEYEYRYDDYFAFDSETGEYYDDNDDDTTRDYFYTDRDSKEDVVEMVMGTFEDNYEGWSFSRTTGMDDARMRNIIRQYYDECVVYSKDREEAQKPHWNVFNYYK